jgi:AraC family transcriptional regulator
VPERVEDARYSDVAFDRIKRENKAMNSHDCETAQLSQAVASILEEARHMLGVDLGIARRCIERAAVLMGGNLAPPSADMDGDCRPKCGGLAPWQMIRVARYVDANLERCASNARMAAEARLGPSYFTRAFRRSFGLTPHAYVLERRVERAKRLMVSTAEPLSQIAVACGFADQAHLSRVFNRSVGCNPQMWRRKRA